MKNNKVHQGPHKYERVKWGKKETPVYRCVLPDCPHYLHPPMMIGKVSLCWSCERAFIINKDKLRRKRPKCDACQFKKGRKGGADVVERLDELLRDL